MLLTVKTPKKHHDFDEIFRNFNVDFFGDFEGNLWNTDPYIVDLFGSLQNMSVALYSDVHGGFMSHGATQSPCWPA